MKLHQIKEYRNKGNSKQRLIPSNSQYYINKFDILYMYVIVCVANSIDTNDLVSKEMPEENVLPWQTTSKIMQLKG